MNIGVQWRIMLNVPFRLTPMTASKFSSFIIAMRPSLVMPAQLIRMSMLPNSFTISATVSLTAAKSATFMRIAFAFTPRASISLTTSAAFSSGSMWMMTTSVPSAASLSAVTLPMPDPPPVTTAVLPIVLYSFHCLLQSFHIAHTIHLDVL